jgi:hypothetical protein
VVPTYKYYLSVFQANHPAVHRFKEKVRQWYQVMQQSRDFYMKLALPRFL